MKDEMLALSRLRADRAIDGTAARLVVHQQQLRVIAGRPGTDMSAFRFPGAMTTAKEDEC